MKIGKNFGWIDKVGDVLRDVGDLADDGIRSVKSAASSKSEQSKIDTLYRRAGQLLYEEFEKTGHCDERLRQMFLEIKTHKENIARAEEEANRQDDVQSVRCTPVRGYSDPSQGVGSTRPCHSCGALCIDSAPTCPSCGARLR